MNQSVLFASQGAGVYIPVVKSIYESLVKDNQAKNIEKHAWQVNVS